MPYIQARLLANHAVTQRYPFADRLRSKCNICRFVCVNYKLLATTIAFVPTGSVLLSASCLPPICCGRTSRGLRPGWQDGRPVKRVEKSSAPPLCGRQRYNLLSMASKSPLKVCHSPGVRRSYPFDTHYICSWIRSHPSLREGRRHDTSILLS